MSAGRATHQRALITGATGFIGSHLAKSLLSDGWEVVALVREGGGIEAHADLQTAVADIRDRARLTEAIAAAQPRVIYHLAADTAVRRFAGERETIDRAIATNFAGTINILFAAQDAECLEAVVRTGGLEEYGRGAVPSGEGQREQPISPYSASQVAATHWCQMLQPHLPFPVVTLRPALVYGPGQRADFLIPAVIAALRRGERFVVNATERRRDYLYIDDLVRALRAAADRAEALGGRVINVASGHAECVGDVARRIAAMMGCTDLLEFAPSASDAGLETVLGDAVLAEQLLGWHPAIGLAEGLARTIGSHA